MSPYDCPICGTKLKVNSPQVIGVHERGKVHQAALKQKPAEKQPVKTVQKTVEAPIPQPATPVIPIQTTKPEEPKPHVPDKKTKTEQKSEEWDGEFF